MSAADERARLLAPAYHEAGHAVAAHSLGYRIRALTVVPQGGRLGRCTIDGPDIDEELTSAAVDRIWVERLRNYILTSLSGSVALRIAGLERDSASDEASAQRLVEQLIEAEGEDATVSNQNQRLGKLTEEAERLIGARWAALERLVEELLCFKALNGEQVHLILDGL